MIIHFRSVPVTRRPQPVNVIDYQGNELGTGTYGSVSDYDFSSVRKHSVEFSARDAVPMVKEVFIQFKSLFIFLLILLILNSFWSWKFPLICLALIIAFFALNYYPARRNALQKQMFQAAVADRGNYLGDLECVEEKKWAKWKKEIDPYGIRRSGDAEL